MGLYDIKCPECGNTHKWFSGNPDQRCADCREETPEDPSQDAIQVGESDIPSSEASQATEIVSEEEKKSRAELRKERMERNANEMREKKAAKSLHRRKEQLKKAANKFSRKRKKMATEHTPMRDLKEFDSAVQAQDKLSIGDVQPGAPLKIVPDIEKLLFPYYVAGASVRSICQQFGDKYGFAIGALYSARDFYKWDQRRNVIRGVVLNDNTLQMAERTKDYMAFFDDLLSEAMIRFSQNSQGGKNDNPFNTLKVTNIKDISDLTKLMMELTNGGVKKVEIENKGGIKISDKKASRLLEILAEDEEDKNDE